MLNILYLLSKYSKNHMIRAESKHFKSSIFHNKAFYLILEYELHYWKLSIWRINVNANLCIYAGANQTPMPIDFLCMQCILIRIQDFGFKLICKFSNEKFHSCGSDLLYLCFRCVHVHMSRDMKFPTKWYVRPAKTLTSLRIRAD